MLTSLASVLLSLVTSNPVTVNSEPAVIPDFTLGAADGSRVSLREGEPQATVLFFVSASCAVTKSGAPKVAELEKQYRSRGVRFLGVDSCYGETAAAANRMASEAGLLFPVLLDPDQRVADRFHVEHAAEVVVLDRDLTVRYQGGVAGQGVGLAPVLDRVLKDDRSAGPKSVSKSASKGAVWKRMPDAERKRSVTFHKDVLPILQQNCQVCHRAGEIGPMALSSYKDVASWAPMIVEVVSQGRMPPWHADPRYGKFSNRRVLTDQEKETLLKWADAGAVEGNASDAPPAVAWPQAEWHIGTPDAVFELPEPIAVPAQGTVPYRYVRVPTHLTEGKWVQAIEVKPGNRKVVHHALVFIETEEEFRKSKGVFSPIGASNVKGHVGVFVPGQGPTVYLQGMAKFLPPNSNLVFQMHYTPTGVAQTDRSSIALKFTDEEPSQQVVTEAVLNLGIRIPPNQKGVSFTAEQTIDKPASLLSYFPHMHVRGQSFKIDLVSQGKTRTLISVPHYDFRWQHQYRLAEPIPLEPGDKVVCTATYDNSKDNPNNPNAGATVFFGEQTWDEMLVGYLEYVIDD